MNNTTSVMPELTAMKSCAEAISSLGPNGRRRVIAYLQDVIETPPDPPPPPDPAPQKQAKGNGPRQG